MILCFRVFILFVVITIGLDVESLTVEEDDGTIEICASVTEGALQRQVVVSVDYEDDEATGGCNLYDAAIYN